MVTDNEKKIPSDYFLYPEFLAFVLLPVTWGLLPIAGFYPELLGGFLPVMFLWTKPIEIVVRFQVSTSIFFKTFEIYLKYCICILRLDEILLYLLTTLNQVHGTYVQRGFLGTLQQNHFWNVGYIMSDNSKSLSSVDSPIVNFSIKNHSQK